MQWNSRRSSLWLISLNFTAMRYWKNLAVPHLLGSSPWSIRKKTTRTEQKHSRRRKRRKVLESQHLSWLSPQSTLRRMGTDAMLPGFVLMHHMLPLRPWFWKFWCLKLAKRHLQMMRCKEPTREAVRCCRWRQQVHLTKKKLRSIYCCAILTPASSLFLDEPNGTIAEKVRAPTFCALTFSEEEDSRPTSWELGKLRGTARWLPIANWPKEVDQNSNVCEVDSC